MDTACSAGLVTVHMACRGLSDGECDLALAGGSAVALDPRKFSAGRRAACCLRPGAVGRSTLLRTGSWAAKALSWCC
ncbi:beta-ketoacyl synthase, N-terminal domain protein [Mycobacterium xenopi 4042]|uniref:Beta-ketoacyl synthase, N-terminal domain protein n=1 Tax=Mycobacterium xenopi 4042 TaxID=1299334 RepID=X8DI95_MYCXE|nr:beta-ketoacyl synthase, N-terminal domain protein [Mycobacterium xenopi 4042]